LFDYSLLYKDLSPVKDLAISREGVMLTSRF
jgi:hypothetical protein